MASVVDVEGTSGDAVEDLEIEEAIGVVILQLQMPLTHIHILQMPRLSTMRR